MSDYFDKLNEQLKQVANGRPAIVLDLDRLDQNIDLIAATLGDRLRVVTKSLPSPQLLDHILKRTGSNKLMAFHQPYLPFLLERYPEVNILMGKPLLAVGVAEVIQALESSTQSSKLARVQWLVDTPTSLREHGLLAQQLGLTLNISIEIDIGLGRGGVSEDFLEMAQVFNQFEGNLYWCGLMGYDAHVPFMGQEVETSFYETMQVYQRYIAQAVSALLETGRPLTFNSGGSQTFSLYGRGSATANEAEIINDVSVGSGFLKPARFPRLTNLEPALYVAAPTLKQFDKPHRKPEDEHETISYIYGGGWPGEFVWPANIRRSRRDDAPNENLMPNQSMVLKSSALSHGIGDFVFIHPHQSDAMFQFEEILVIKHGDLVDRWQPIPRRY